MKVVPRLTPRLNLSRLGVSRLAYASMAAGWESDKIEEDSEKHFGCEVFRQVPIREEEELVLEATSRTVL